MATTIGESDQKTIKKEFREVVNMTAHQLEAWLKTEESKSVGQKEGSEESTGHQMGKHIIDLLGKKDADLTDDDYHHMDKVVGYVKRHSAQQPKQVAGSNWEYSLKNWGHDPEKNK